jgi:two-component system nitrogen regulation response regulator GlnG/two-component system response regulator HydG
LSSRPGKAAIIATVSEATGTDPRWLERRRRGDESRAPLCLVIAWSLAEPWRIGQVSFLSSRQATWILGRGSGEDSNAEARCSFSHQRPGGVGSAPPLEGRGLSRRHLAIRPGPGTLAVERIGRAAVRVNGAAIESATVAPGDVLAIEGELVLFCAARARGAISERGDVPRFAFGAPDPFGVVGESPRAWLLRDEIAFAARRPQHLLILGPSGTGKELAAGAAHRQSDRARAAFVSRNAATLPAGIIDAELFGNVKNYPNAGMPEREGLVGAADGGTLFLDEISELPDSLQAHLLRLLDSGEYQRLGESRVRRADLRVVGATNRGIEALKHDLAARFALRLELPGLDALREDIPLIARHLLRLAAERDPALATRFFESTPHGPEPRFAPELVEALLRHGFTHHVRELESLLLLSMSKSPGQELELTPEVEARLDLPSADPARETPEGLSAEQIRAALRRQRGSVTRAARELGLKNRDVLYRLMKKHGVKLEQIG